MTKGIYSALSLIACQLTCFAPLALDALVQRTVCSLPPSLALLDGMLCVISVPLNWLVWLLFLPSVFIAIRIDPRPPPELTYGIAYIQACAMGFILWRVWLARTEKKQRNANQGLERTRVPRAAQP